MKKIENTKYLLVVKENLFRQIFLMKSMFSIYSFDTIEELEKSRKKIKVKTLVWEIIPVSENGFDITKN